MTTSNVYNYSLTRDQIIETALRKLGVLAEGQVPSAQNYLDANIALNSVVAQFKAMGMPVWAQTEYSFTPDVSSYTIGPGQTLNTATPIKLLRAHRTENNAKISLEIQAKEDFMVLPITYGKPIKVHFKPVVNGGIISFWPYPTATDTSLVTLLFTRSFQYFNASTDTPDFPEEWYNAIIYQTAAKLAPEWGVPLPDRQLLLQEAKMYTEEALLNGQEAGSFFLQPERRF